MVLSGPDIASSWISANQAVLTVLGRDPDAPLAGPARPILSDLDADGRQDLALGGNAGEVAVFFDSAGLTGTVSANDADLIISGSEVFGGSMDAGDVDGDGLLNLVLEAPGVDTSAHRWFDDETEAVGALFLFLGPLEAGTLDSDQADATTWGEGTGSTFGAHIRLADLDQDGAAEIVTIAPRVGDEHYRDAGKAYVLPDMGP